VTATTYIRWGREDCSGNTTDLVYSGYVGGSHYNHNGAAVDFVCLPKDPSWGPKADVTVHAGSFMYGAEYQDPIIYNVPDLNRKVPCAVCRKSSHSTTIMIPARTKCYPGWKEAYHGYLSSGHYTHPAATQYVCVDENPQTVVGGADTNDDGILFYPVSTRCGSLKCPPYEDDKILSCVVCMK
ncbi:short-chain collagen C4-like, partial [Argopecten irradians]|uniref:short-chain collagen C4-like n=1 Tax=Argopecten irradians TaxID=31199 RepID=UPI003714D306